MAGGWGWNQGPLYYSHDGLGNVTDVRSYWQNNAVVVSYRYAPFGAVVPNYEVYDQPFKFQTKLWVGSCGLGYWGYRWYDPASGVWLSKDPLREAGWLTTSKPHKNQ